MRKLLLIVVVNLSIRQCESGSVRNKNAKEVISKAIPDQEKYASGNLSAAPYEPMTQWLFENEDP